MFLIPILFQPWTLWKFIKPIDNTSPDKTANDPLQQK